MRNLRSHVRFLALAFLATLAACAASGDDAPGNGDEPIPAIGEIGGMCGGIAGFQCKAEAAYCKVEPGVCREVADYAGVCAIRPEVCTKEYRPVCGCDGKTYSNACMAAVAGASIAHQGICPDEDKS